MKNTPENKERFFAQYWGQKVISTEECSTTFLGEVGTEIPASIGRIDHFFLVLKPLSQITDEDAIEVAEILTDERIEVRSIDRGKEIYIHLINKNRIILYDNSDGYSMDDGYLDSVTGSFEDLKFHDFLRSRGYALPWMGISVEEQIEFGWIKLKEI